MTSRTVSVVLLALASPAFASDGPVKDLGAAVSRIAARSVTVSRVDAVGSSLTVSGTAKTHEAVAEFVKDLASLVRTPLGLGRDVERKRDQSITVRVELLSKAKPELMDFARTELESFDVELISAQKISLDGGSVVRFEVSIRPRPREKAQ